MSLGSGVTPAWMYRLKVAVNYGRSNPAAHNIIKALLRDPEIPEDIQDHILDNYKDWYEANIGEWQEQASLFSDTTAQI